MQSRNERGNASVTKAVFLDRDGVINRKPPEGDYVTRWEDFHFLPGVVESIAEMNRAGFEVIVVTNQRCIAKGLMTVSDLESIHQRMSDFLERAGAIISAIYYCPHEMEAVCSCRKPAPGMFVEAAREHEIELSTSWMIGDSDIDMEAGEMLDVKPLACWPRVSMAGQVAWYRRLPLTSSRRHFLMLSPRYCNEGLQERPTRHRGPFPERIDRHSKRSETYDNHSHSPKDLFLRRWYRLSRLVS